MSDTADRLFWGALQWGAVAVIGVAVYGGYVLAKGGLPEPRKETAGEHHCKDLIVRLNNGTTDDVEGDLRITKTYCNQNPWMEPRR